MGPHTYWASTFPQSQKLGLNVGNRVCLVAPLGFFIALNTCRFLFPYSVRCVHAPDPGVRCPCGPSRVHIPFHADRFLPWLG